ncbi:unnamed protein product [Dovyalis caffra]|uniref:Uncharacterized protein n=1 Tax=Dovyalis caffra TaxID=77055 RepID=A0AAV1RUC5_9ROSI|nr:unnamed protein product [Dovyalis caffra]
MWAVPPIVLALAKQNLDKKYNLSSLKNIGYGAVLLRKDLMNECAKNTFDTIIGQAQAMIEPSSIVSVEDSRISVQHSGYD